MEIPDRIAFLKATDLLGGAPEHLLRQIGERMEAVDLGAGTTLFREGDAGDAVYLVVEGTLRLENEGIPLMARRRGDCVGEFALIDDAPRSASAIAETDVRLLKWERDAFQEAVSGTTEVAYGIFKILIEKLREDIGIQVEAARELRRANQRLEQENRSLRVQVAPEPEVVYQSPRMQEVLDLAWKVAESSSTVLLRGDSGTGKEVVARGIHGRSLYREGPFVPVHCASLPASLLESELFGHEKGAFTGATAQRPGRFELADGGTLFLDEVGEIEPEIQIKLLRVLQERRFERVGGSRTLQVNVRVIAATNRNLEKAMGDGTFREDLYYRLNVIPIVLPPLRERREDIPVLVTHFLDHYSREMAQPELRVSDEAMDQLLVYAWPGNVRELQNLIERMIVVVDGEAVLPRHLPPEVRGEEAGRGVTGAAEPSGGLPTLAEMERRHVEAALIRCGWNQSQAARLLDISRDQLRHRIKRYGIQGDWHVGAPTRN